MPDFDPQFIKQQPEGDTHVRDVCERCGFIDYQNPKIVVGSVVTKGDQFLLVRRAIEPRYGFWTLPAGYLERHEAAEDGAKREAYEEALATIKIDTLLAVYSILHLSQIQLMYRATLVGDDFAAGDESLEAKLFAWDEIPWDELAFPSVKWALDHWQKVKGQTAFGPFTTVADASSRHA